MATRLPRSPIVAVDTNVPLDLADRKEHTLDALDVVRRRLKPGRILVTPTVFQELVLRGLNFQRASLELKAFDVEMPVIATPREIAAKFF